ncbi:hypothetical protein Golob_004861 [Gossypium lobatum]|uniref:Uncharacterized protein n=1 Tax=Gossypium lobatum TaxID=34289 RepID=A0A7J8N379_9ROSI|nr:hypothetical protein [Gossypium lobatum]
MHNNIITEKALLFSEVALFQQFPTLNVNWIKLSSM